MNGLRLTPLFLSAALLLGGCAGVRHVDSIIPPEDGNDCWSTVRRDAIKGDQIIGTAIIDRRYSDKCGDDRVRAARYAAMGDVESARIEAISRLLRPGLPDGAGVNKETLTFCLTKSERKDGGLHFSCR